MDIKYSKSLEKVSYVIRELVPIAKEVEKKGKKIIYLNIGDPLKYDFKTPSHIIDAYYEASVKGHNYYSESQGIRELRNAISRHIKKISGVDVDPEYVIVTSGVAEAINFIIRVFMDPGEEILVPSPSYPSYIGSPYLYYGKAVEYRCIEDEGWRPDVDDLRDKINERTRLIVVVNPNNPTGALYSHKALREIVDIAAEHDIPIVSDEIYDQIILDGQYTSLSSIAKDNLVIGLNGFSKAYLMTGWRLGYIYINDPTDRYKDDIREGILRQARLRLCVNTPVQYAGIAALEGPQDHIRDMIDKLRRRRDLMIKWIDENEFLTTQRPDATFYMFPKIINGLFRDDREFVINLLKEEGVFIVYGSGFGKLSGTMHFRAVFLPRDEIINEAMYRMSRFITRRIRMVAK
jgi:aspartate/methionine/tyrosine aminotransferase